MSDDHEAWVEQDVDRVTEEVLDAIGPVLAWWRVEAARRLGLDAASLACLDLVRRHRRVSSSLIAERSGLTRSAVSKLLRRLRDAGHVELVGGGERGRAVEVVLRPHAERDAELERIRRRLRDRLRWSVGSMFDEGERATALRVLREIAGALQLTAAESVDAAAEERRARERRAAGLRRVAAEDDLDGAADRVVGVLAHRPGEPGVGVVAGERAERLP